MKTELKNLIEQVQPEFTDTNATISRYSLPNEVLLYLNNDDYLVDISLTDGILETDLYVGEDEVELSAEDVDWLYNYLEGLLTEQIELSKQYYEAERYESELSWYIQ
jgi:hypothetical protein